MRSLRLLRLIFIALMSAAVGMELGAADSARQSFSQMTGSELVTRLQDEKDRLRAFYELWRRARPDKDEGFGAFAEGHYDPEVIVCPQERGERPIYLVLYGFLGTRSFAGSANYVVKEPEELFPPGEHEPKRQPGERPAIEAFAADGRRVEPFGGSNVLDGTLADINGDGLVERAEITHYRIEGMTNVDVLHISTVKEKEQPLLAVLLNWGANEWTFRLRDPDADGISDIELGPRTPDGLEPNAVFKWDPAKRAYAGPVGAAGDHFRVLDRGKTWKESVDELRRFRVQGLTFPKEPDATGGAGASKQAMAGTPSATPQAPATESEPIISNHLPPDFWTSDPRAAALALADANRTEKHRASFRLAIDNRDGAQPPGRCTIAFSGAGRGYNVAANYFLRVDPEDSYLAYTRKPAGSDLRLCRLPYRDARQAAGVIWWLDRVRSKSIRAEWGVVSSTADGGGKLTFRADDGAAIIERADKLWAGELSQRWNRSYDHEVFFNFGVYVLTDALTQRLGNEWAQYESMYSTTITGRQKRAATDREVETRRKKELAMRFMEWFTPAQEKISFAIVAEAARAAAVFSMAEVAPKLRAIDSALPPDKPGRTYEEVSWDRHKIDAALQLPNDPRSRDELEERRRAVNAEIDTFLYDSGADRPAHLRRAIKLALRQIAAAQDRE